MPTSGTLNFSRMHVKTDRRFEASVCLHPCDLEKTLDTTEPREINFQRTFDDYEQNFIADELRLRISSDV